MSNLINFNSEGVSCHLFVRCEMSLSTKSLAIIIAINDVKTYCEY